MGSGSGRTARKRKRRKRSVRTASLRHQQRFVRLMTFLRRRGFNSALLQPAHFPDTGRGLQTRHTVKPGQLVISLPQSCLLTTTTVLDSYLGPPIRSWKPRLSPLLVLCVFLVCERHRGEASDWFPYIDTLPAAYTCPVYFPGEVLDLLPAGVRRRALEQREAVREIHSANQQFFRSLTSLLRRPAEGVLTYEALRWAWCSVNTRSVFMSQPPNNFLSGTDHYALAPFLDLLNHQPDVQVEAGFNAETKCYEIRSVSGMQRHQQAFINYGSHDNQRLLLEYGFVAAPNPHSVVYVDADLLCDVLSGDASLSHKMKFLRENDFLRNLTLSSDGPSWRLMTTLRLTSLPLSSYVHWRAVLLGQAVCEEREAWSVRAAVAICRRLERETVGALEQLDRLLQQCERPIREQLDAVMSLRREERCILGNCLQALQGSGTA